MSWDSVFLNRCFWPNLTDTHCSALNETKTSFSFKSFCFCDNFGNEMREQDRSKCKLALLFIGLSRFKDRIWTDWEVLIVLNVMVQAMVQRRFLMRENLLWTMLRYVFNQFGTSRLRGWRIFDSRAFYKNKINWEGRENTNFQGSPLSKTQQRI